MYHIKGKYNKIFLKDKMISSVLSLSLLSFRTTEVE